MASGERNHLEERYQDVISGTSFNSVFIKEEPNADIGEHGNGNMEEDFDDMTFEDYIPIKVEAPIKVETPIKVEPTYDEDIPEQKNDSPGHVKGIGNMLIGNQQQIQPDGYLHGPVGLIGGPGSTAGQFGQAVPGIQGGAMPGQLGAGVAVGVTVAAALQQQPQQQQELVPVQQQQAQQQQQRVRESQTIWQGVLQWIEKARNPNDSQKLRHILCQVSSNPKNGEPELKFDSWPQRLIVQLMPKQLIGNVGGIYLKNSKSVLFHPQNCEALESLTRVMCSGFAGCVHFVSTSPTSACDIKVLILLYTSEKRAYLGFIPNDQTTFVDRLRRVIQQSKSTPSLTKQGQELPTQPSTSKASQVTTAATAQNKKRKTDDIQMELVQVIKDRFRKLESQCEITATLWAFKLARMENGQRRLAEKFINNVIFEGECGNLKRNSVVINVEPT